MVRGFVAEIFVRFCIKNVAFSRLNFNIVISNVNNAFVSSRTFFIKNYRCISLNWVIVVFKRHPCALLSLFDYSFVKKTFSHLTVVVSANLMIVHAYRLHFDNSP